RLRAACARAWSCRRRRARRAQASARGGRSAGLSSPPQRLPWSLQILNLLAELLDDALELEPDIGELDVIRLGAQRVGLALQLLREEIQPAPDGTAACQQISALVHMRSKSIQLLADVGLGGNQNCFLMQTIRIETVGNAKQRRDLLGEP